jgi:hypothetical protein
MLGCAVAIAAFILSVYPLSGLLEVGLLISNPTSGAPKLHLHLQYCFLIYFLQEFEIY